MALTLSSDVILQDTLDAFKVDIIPMLTQFSYDFSDATARKDDTIKAHIAKLAAVQDYDASTGFANNAAEVTTLLEDVPVTLDRLKHVPVKIDYLDQIASRKDLYREAIRNQAYVLGKSVIDYVLSLCSSTNLTYEAVQSAGNTTKATLDTIAGSLNTRGAMRRGRFGFVNTDVFNSLESDQKIASGDYHDQRRTDDGYGHLVGVSGFANIWEYPDFPGNSENQTGLFGDRRTAVIATRVPADTSQIAQAVGIPNVTKFQTITDPDTGLTLFMVAWMGQATLDLFTSIGLLYGAKVGKQGGSADTITDKAAVRLVTQATS